MALQRAKGKVVEGSVNSIADLPATGFDGQVIGVASFYGVVPNIVPDGGGGRFVYDASANANLHDGGTIIDSTHTVTPGAANWWTAETGTGVWRRIYNGGIHSLWFGCKGDGSTDDSASLQKVFDVGVALSVKILIDKPSSFYVVNSTISCTNNFAVTIEFENAVDRISQTPYFKRVSGTDLMMDFTGASALTVINMSLDGNSLATTGILLIGTTSYRVVQCKFDRLNVANCTTYGLDIGDATSKQCDDISFNHIWLASNAIGVHVRGGNTEQLRFTDGQIAGATTYGINILEGGVICDTVTFTGNTTADIYIQSATQHNQDFINCYSESSGMFLQTNNDVNASRRSINIYNCHLLSKKSITTPGLAAVDCCISHRNNMSIIVMGCKGSGFSSDMNKSGSHGTVSVIDIGNTWDNEGINPDLVAGNDGFNLSQLTSNRVMETGRKIYSIAKTTGFTIPPELSGSIITNQGIGGGTTLVLPTMVNGLTITIIRTASFVIHIDLAIGSDSIRGGAPGKYMSLDSNGAMVTLVALEAVWEILSKDGTITYEP